MQHNSEFIELYRVENPRIIEEPNGITSREEIKGQWFSPDINTALNYLRKSTRQEGTRLVIAKVPKDKLPSMHILQSDIAKGMDVENDNYLIPRDGSFDIDYVEVDPIIGDLRGKLGNVKNWIIAKQLVSDAIDKINNPDSN